MGIGFQIIIVTLFLTCVLAILLLSIKFSNRFELARGAKYLILYSFVGLTITFILMFVVGLTVQVLDNLFPTRIFESSFKFEPNEKVKNLFGSAKFFSLNGNGKIYLEFTTEKDIVEKIKTNRIFVNKLKGSYIKANNQKLINLLKKEDTVLYVSTQFEEYCNEELVSPCLAYLVHNEKTGKVYFIW